MRWRLGQLASNTALATVWQGIRLIIQIAYLILVARVLGAYGYGVFAGCVALAGSLSPLVGLGFGMILVKEVSRNPASFPAYWAKALLGVFLSAPVFAAAMLLLANVLLPAGGHWQAILLISIAELLAMPLVSVCALAFQAHEQLGRTAFNHVQLNLARLLAIGLLAQSGSSSIFDFAWTYFGATAFAATLSLVQVSRAFGGPAWRQGTITGRLKEGLSFSLGMIANSAHGEIDKALLLRMDGAATAGTYSAASRVISAASIPIISYVISAVPGLFRAGESGISAGARTAWKLLPPALSYGALAGGGIFVLAELLPILLGDDFSGSVPIVRALAALPLLLGVSNLLLAVLTCSGAQRVRIWLEAVALGVNLVLNVALIPVFGAFGAASAILASQVVLTSLAAAAIFHLSDQENRE
jgi:O-antigen/teichoic acid export membrane protein